MNRAQNNPIIDNGGFRVAWFIPLEAIIFGLMLTIGLKYGFERSVPIVGFPAYILIKKIANYKTKLPLKVGKKQSTFFGNVLQFNLK